MKTIRKFSHRWIQYFSRVKDTKIKKKAWRTLIKVAYLQGEIDSPLSTHEHIYVFPSKSLKCLIPMRDIHAPSLTLIDILMHKHVTMLSTTSLVDAGLSWWTLAIFSQHIVPNMQIWEIDFVWSVERSICWQ